MIKKRKRTLCFSLFLALSMFLGQLLPVTAEDNTVPQTEEQTTETAEIPTPEPELTEDVPEHEPVPTDNVEGQGEETVPDQVLAETTEGEEPAPEEEETVEYQEKVDGIKVSVTADKGAFPENAALKVSKLDPGSSEYKKAEKTLDSQNYEYSGFMAMDIHFEVDDQEVEPAEGKQVQVNLSVNKTKLPEETEALNTLEVQHHEEDGATVTAKPVAAAADSTVNVEGQTVTADFTVESFSTFTITWKNDSKTTYETGVYNLYTYLLIPGSDPDADTSPNDRWMGAGVYKIKAPNAPSASEAKTPYTEILADASYDLRVYDPKDPNKKDYTDSKGSTYPDITYNNKAYSYDSAGNKARTYSIAWFRLVDAHGANAGHNGYNNTVDYGTPAYHLDGQIVFVDTTKITVDFKVKKPGETEFGLVGNKDNSQPFTAMYDSGTNESKVLIPTENNSSWTQTIVKGGITYEFDGWYKDEAMTQKATWSEILNANQTYYGSYKPSTVTLKVTNTVSGNMGNYKDDFSYVLKLYSDPERTNLVKENQITSTGETGEGIAFSDGVYTFGLAHGETTKTLTVPNNLYYTITQTDGHDHVTKATSGRAGEFFDGNYVEGGSATQTHSHDLKQDTVVAFTNHKQADVPSGLSDHDNYLSAFMLSAGSAIILLAMIIGVRRRMSVR